MSEKVREIKYKSGQTALKKAQQAVAVRQRNANHMADGMGAWMLGQGALTDEWVEKNRLALTPSRYVAYKTALQSQASETEHPKEFAEMMELLSDEKTSQRQYVDKLLLYKNAQKINPDEYSRLIHLGMIDPEKDPVFKTGMAATEEMVKAQLKKEEMVKEHKSFVQSAWQMMKDYASGVEILFTMGKNLIDKFKAKPEAKLPDIAKEVIKDQITKDHPETNMLEGAPNTVMSAKEKPNEIWKGQSKAIPNYTIQNGKVVPVGAKKERQAGDTVYVKGKKMRIKAILPDGKYDVEDAE